jgi:hypothetical protein
MLFGMKVFITIFSVTLMLILVNIHEATAGEHSGPPTPLERAKMMIAENKAAMTINALSIYHPSHEELSDYYYVFAKALQATGKSRSRSIYRLTVDERPGDVRTAADTEWAYYRIASIAKGEDSENCLKATQAENNAIGRFTAAELIGAQLRKRAE